MYIAMWSSYIWLKVGQNKDCEQSLSDVATYLEQAST